MSTMTTDLSEFGSKELRQAEEILTAWNMYGLPENFINEGVEIAFNPHSGYVFLKNDHYQTAMLYEGELKRWYVCPGCGTEGFDFQLEDEGYDCCKELIE